MTTPAMRTTPTRYHWTGNTPKKDLVGVRSYTVVMSFDDHGYKTCNVKAKGLIK